MKNIVEDILKKYPSTLIDSNEYYSKENVMSAMIDFATYHVHNALGVATKEAIINYDPDTDPFPRINMESMFDSYPDSNISGINIDKKNEIVFDKKLFYEFIENKWKEYRFKTNNEDAWCFKQWLVGK